MYDISTFVWKLTKIRIFDSAWLNQYISHNKISKLTIKAKQYLLGLINIFVKIKYIEKIIKKIW